MLSKRIVKAAATAAGILAAAPLLGAPASAQSGNLQRMLVEQSHLTRITKAQRLRVCMYPEYFAISFRNPKTGELEGLDVDIAKELATSLQAKLEIVESSFSTFVADLLADKCDIGMFGLIATLRRAQAVEFSEPYAVTGVFAVIRSDNPKVKTWADLDQDGVTVAVKLGSVAEPLMKGYLKKAKVVAVQPPATAEQEVAAKRADALSVDFAIATQIASVHPWAKIIGPDQPLLRAPYAYVVAPGDQIWLNYVNLFVQTIKRDGRLKKLGDKHNLGPILELPRN